MLIETWIILILVGSIALVLIASVIFRSTSTKKLMKKQIKITKDVLEESKDDLTEIARMQADISKEGVEITARSVKTGFSEEKVYCKHCKNLIDKNSKFCKNCGKHSDN